MQTRALRTLVKIWDVGSFAVAAEQLNMTLSAVSMQIKNLEQMLSVELFDRAHRPPKLTPLGLSVCRHASSVLQAEAALLEFCQPSDQLTGEFRIGFIPTANVRLLPLFLINARTYAPNAKFTLETGLSENLEQRVLNGQLDAAVVTASVSRQTGLRYDLIREERLAFAAPASMAGRSPSAIASQLPFLHFTPKSGIGKVIEDHMNRLGLTGTGPTLVLDSIEATMECVNHGVGFTLLPQPDIERYGDDTVTVIPQQNDELARLIVLATSADSAVPLKTDQLAMLFY